MPKKAKGKIVAKIPRSTEWQEDKKAKRKRPMVREDESGLGGWSTTMGWIGN